jgi:predicted TIM-barrel fold metal-dependent hydrolase
MRTYEELLDFINPLSIIDTHEHLPLEARRPADMDVLAEWLIHYFSCDLRSAGLSADGLNEARDSKKNLASRWKLVEPYWHAAESTGYGRALAIAARDVYGIAEINADTITELNTRFVAARAKGGHYRRVLKELSKIAVTIRDALDPADKAAEDPFVFTLRTDPFIALSHYNQAREIARQIGLTVHSLDDWKRVTRESIARAFAGRSRVVCLKLGLAYLRSLRYDKATQSEAEQEFNRLFEDRNLPDWRPGQRLGPAFENHMQHWVCQVADDLGLTYQIHTGIQEGNGNIIYDSNPVLLSNLFLEYANVKFDLFHMGYPYTMELGNLAKNFPNVYIDMCWGHIISPEAARRALVEWLDAVPANKISAFGGDYCFVDGVYGHQYLARRDVAAALAQKTADGSFGLERAKEIAQWVFVDNPRRIFGLDKYLGAKAKRATR